jgi:mRNA interferase MazF
MARTLKGDIIWANLSPTIGHGQAGMRTILVLSHEVFNKYSGTVIAVAITNQPQKAGFPLTLELVGTKLPKKSWVKISQIRTLSIKHLRKKIGAARPEVLDLVVEGMNEIIGGYPLAAPDNQGGAAMNEGLGWDTIANRVNLPGE